MDHRWKLGALAAAGTLALIVLVALPSWAAEDTATADKPSLALTQTEGLELVASGEGVGRLRVTLSNSGPGDVTPIIALVREGATGFCGEDFAPTGDAVHQPIPAGGHDTIDLTFEVADDCIGTAATLLVDGNPTIKTVTGAVSTVREIGPGDYTPPLIVAALSGLAFLAIAGTLLFKQLGNRTATGTSWSFAGSWLTSISAVSTALAGILAASGFIGEVLPGVPLGHFLGLSLTLGILVVAAPMAFSIFQVTEWEKGTATEKDPEPDPVQVVNGRLVGVLVAGSLTCAGVAGQLTMLAVLTQMSQASDGSKVAVLALLGLSALVLAIYVTISTKQANSLSRRRVGQPDGPANTAEVGAVSSLNAGLTGTF